MRHAEHPVGCPTAGISLAGTFLRLCGPFGCTDCRLTVPAWSPVRAGLNPAAKRIDEILAGGAALGLARGHACLNRGSLIIAFTSRYSSSPAQTIWPPSSILGTSCVFSTPERPRYGGLAAAGTQPLSSSQRGYYCAAHAPPHGGQNLRR